MKRAGRKLVVGDIAAALVEQGSSAHCIRAAVTAVPMTGCCWVRTGMLARGGIHVELLGLVSSTTTSAPARG